MGQIIDTCVWVDHLRKGTPGATRRTADAALNDAEALLCETVHFELMMGASQRERPRLLRRLETMPLLQPLPQLWPEAGKLAALASDAGLRILSVGFMIAAICRPHRVAVTAFDAHFRELGRLLGTRVNRLIRTV